MKRLKQHIKVRMLIGFFQLLKPSFYIFVGFKFLQIFIKFVGNYEFKAWDLLAYMIPLEAPIIRTIFISFLLAMPYLVGIFSISRFAGKKRRLKALNFKVFASGGHKRILIREQGPKTSWRPGVVTSRSMDGDEEMLSFIVIKFSLPNTELLERRYTRIIDHPLKVVLDHQFSYGLNPPKDWQSREWTDEEYYAIPHEEELLES